MHGLLSTAINTIHDVTNKQKYSRRVKFSLNQSFTASMIAMPDKSEARQITDILFIYIYSLDINCFIYQKGLFLEY